MSRRALVLAVAGVACALVAAFAALLAHDVWRVDEALRRGDVRAGAQKVGPGSWAASTLLPGSIARDLLGVEDDLRLRDILVRGRAELGRYSDQARDAAYERAKADLVTLSHGADPVRASLAETLLGLIALGEPDDPDRTAVEKAADRFTRAVQLDPGNDLAKANLELMIYLIEGDDSTRGEKSSGGDVAGRGAGKQEVGAGF